MEVQKDERTSAEADLAQEFGGTSELAWRLPAQSPDNQTPSPAPSGRRVGEKMGKDADPPHFCWTCLQWDLRGDPVLGTVPAYSPQMPDVCSAASCRLLGPPMGAF